MRTSRKSRKRRAEFRDILNLISSIALIIIAAVLLIFVFGYIRNTSFFDVLKFGSSSKDKDIVIAETTADEQGGTTESAEAVVSFGLTWLENGKLVYLLNQSEISSYDRENIISLGEYSALASYWLDYGGDIYYFGEDGYAVSEFSEGAMEYRFDHDFMLKSIEYNKNYHGTQTLNSADYPGLIVTKTLWAFLDKSKQTGDFYAIKYRKASDSLSYELGGGSNPQYTSEYSMSVVDGYIYYLAVGNSTDKVLEPIVNKLFRMKPGDEHREIAAENVAGYKILGSGNDLKVYYYDGTRIRAADSFIQDESMKVFPEDANYYVETSGSKATLMIEGGYPVTMESASFSAGNFYYKLAADGEILSVASKSKVSLGGYTYTVENGEAFGSKKARLLRQDKAGTIEVISAEFIGEVGNLHYDYGTSRIIAEYVDADGSAGLLSISTDGDVDILSDARGSGNKCTLYSIQNGNAIVKTGDSSQVFKTVSLKATYPLAIGVDPIMLESDDPQSETVNAAEATAAAASAEAPTTNSSKTAAAAETTAAAPSGDSSSGQDQVVVSQGPEDGSAEAAIINNNTVDHVGPGE
ncbi:MAG: hypothetical protein Q4E57_10920 [Eubacteriales bacterium]|nr:hypothetical protein [Eubacteriales bacterium]